MNFAFLQDFGPLGILFLGAAVCVALEIRGSGGGGGRVSRWVALGSVAVAFLVSIAFWRSSLGPAPPEIEHGGFLIDRFALFFYAAGPAAAGALLLAGADLESELDPHRPMYHALLLVSTAGVLFTASAANLVSLLVGIVIAVLPLGMAVGLRKTDPAGLRATARGLAIQVGLLVVLGGGEAVVAGVAGGTSLRAALAVPPGPLVALGAALVVVGAAGLVGVFPLTSWRARAADGVNPAPAWAGLALTAMAVTALLLRLLPGTLASSSGSWSLTVGALAGLTLLVAPVLAFRQRRLIPALGFLLVAQAAQALIALPDTSRAAVAAILYLLLGLVPMAAAVLALAGALRPAPGGDTRLQLRGLAGRSPLLATAVALVLAAVAGLPPLAAFFARVMVLDATLQAGLGWLAWITVAGAVLSALTGLRWILVLLDPRTEGAALPLPGRATLVGLGLCAVSLVGFTVVLGPLMGIAARAALPPLAGP